MDPFQDPAALDAALVRLLAIESERLRQAARLVNARDVDAHETAGLAAALRRLDLLNRPGTPAVKLCVFVVVALHAARANPGLDVGLAPHVLAALDGPHVDDFVFGRVDVVEFERILRAAHLLR